VTDLGTPGSGRPSGGDAGCGFGASPLEGAFAIVRSPHPALLRFDPGCTLVDLDRAVREASAQHGDILLAFADLSLESPDALHVHPSL